MTTGETKGKGWLARPGVLIVGLVIGLIIGVVVALAVVKATQGGNDSDAAAASASGAAEAETGSKPGAEGSTGTASEGSTEEKEEAPEEVSEADKSVCGLKGAVLEKARLTSPPKAENWDYDGTIAYPVSKEYGPGATAPEGHLYCFQHSPEGALFAASYAAARGSASGGRAWADNLLSKDTPSRDQHMSKADEKPDTSNSRFAVNGFRLLSYDGQTANVEIAFTYTKGGSSTYGSAVYHYVWEDGDWKILPKSIENPFEVTALPEISGYIPWGN